MTFNPNPGVYPRKPSIAIVDPGNRTNKITVPLETTDLDWAVEPDDAYERDIVMMDMINRKSVPAMAKSKLNGSAFVYRMRGDIFAEMPGYDRHWLLKWGALNLIMPRVDAVLAVTDYFAERYEEETGVTQTGVAGLWKRPDEYSVTEHQDEEVRAITLTNANYEEKVMPILKWAPWFEQWADEHAAGWVVGARGKHEEKLRIGLEDYEHVSFLGYVDKHEWLDWANTLFHPSRLDGLPNAILEGMVSGLPVITTDWVTFERYDGPIRTVSNQRELRDALFAVQTPGKRAELGHLGREYIETHHTPEQIGQEYKRFFMELVNDE